ncbi:MAG: hypothetical protein WAS33_30860, partial [Candidatus Promineifilaceae bacterium]
MTIINRRLVSNLAASCWITSVTFSAIIALPGIIREKELVQFNLDIQGKYDLETLPLQIVQSLETHLELSFAVLWLAHEPEIGILETYTDHAPASSFPGEMPLETVWQYGVQ